MSARDDYPNLAAAARVKWAMSEGFEIEMARALDEIDRLRGEPVVPTPAPGQIWVRKGSELRNVRVEAFVPDTSLGQLVVFTWCGIDDASPHIEHVERFLKRCTYLGGPW